MKDGQKLKIKMNSSIPEITNMAVLISLDSFKSVGFYKFNDKNDIIKTNQLQISKPHLL